MSCVRIQFHADVLPSSCYYYARSFVVYFYFTAFFFLFHFFCLYFLSIFLFIPLLFSGCGKDGWGGDGIELIKIKYVLYTARLVLYAGYRVPLGFDSVTW